MNEITIVVRSRDETRLDQVGKQVDTVGAKAEGASTKVDQLNATFDRLDKYQADAAKRSAALAAEMDKVTVSSKGLTNGLTTGLETGVKDALPQVEKAGSQAASSFMDAVTATLPATAPMLAAALALVFAAAGGGALATAGGGALAAGIIAQLHDPAIKAEATDLAHWLGTEFEYVTKPLAPELSLGLGDLRNELAPVFGELRTDFAALAPYVQTFAHFLGQAAQQFMPGFSRALQASGPVLGVISRELPTLANAANIFFDEVSKGSKGGAEALDTLIKGFSMLVAGLGFGIRAMENTWDVFVQLLDKGTGILAKMPGLINPFRELHDYVHGIATSFDNGTSAASAFGGALGSDTVSAAGLGAALGTVNRDLAAYVDLTGQASNEALAKSVIAVTQAVDGLTKSLQQNGTAFDDTTAKGAANTAAYLAGVDAARAHADAVLKSTGSAQAAAAAYQADIDKLDAAARAAGATRSEVAKLDQEFSQVDAVHDFYIRTHFITEGTPPSQFFHGLTTGGVVGAASGMARGGLTWVGEQGPELVRLPYGSSVMSNPDSMSYATQAAGTAPAPQFYGWIGPGANSALVAALQQLYAMGQLRFVNNPG